MGVDSSVLAFEIAARAAWREHAKECKPALLEPVMKVEVCTPQDYLNNVINDINGRRGMVTSLVMRANLQVVNAEVPLACMFNYISNLRSMSKGRASFSMEFDKYAQVPSGVAEEVMKGGSSGKK